VPPLSDSTVMVSAIEAATIPSDCRGARYSAVTAGAAARGGSVATVST
jgi:hypothetical protein